MNSGESLRLLFSDAEIETAVERLALQITADLSGKTPLLIGVLKGCFIFMSDLVRRLDFPLEVDFIRLSSYGSGTESSGKVEVVQGLKTDITSRHVLVVEDIVDTGVTAAFLLDYLKKSNPESVRLCALTDKPSRRKVPVPIDYLGLTVPDKFLVGYGLDCDGRYRNLPELYVLEQR